MGTEWWFTCKKCICFCSLLGAMACWCIWLAGSEEEPSQGTKIIIVHSRMASICAQLLCCFWLLSLLCVLLEERRAHDLLHGLGFLTSFWNMSKRIVHGHSSVQMKLQVSQTSGVMNLRVYMSSMRKRCTPSQSLNDMPCQDRSNFWDLIVPSQRYLTSSTLSQGTAKKRFKLKSYDLQYSRLKLRLAIPTCSSRYASSFLNGWNTMATSSYAMTTVSWKMNWKHVTWNDELVWFC